MDESPSSSSSDSESDCVLLNEETGTSLNDTESQSTTNNAKTDKDRAEDFKEKSFAKDEGTAKDSIMMEVVYDKKEIISTPKKHLTPKKTQKLLDSEKKRQQKQLEKEEREKQKQEEKAKLLADKQKIKEQKEAERQKQLEEKQKQIELKQKEKELKEEQRRKEKEEKEMKRKEKEEQEARKRKEKEEERLKKLREIEEKNKEKQKEEELKQKSAALFKNFFKKTDEERAEELNQSKAGKMNSNFMPFEVKSDMKLPPRRRRPLTEEQLNILDSAMQSQDGGASYLKCLKSQDYQPGVSGRTWPYEDPEDDVTIVEDDKVLGQTICEDTGVAQKMKVKFLFFHENRRPAYYGTWRKTSKCVKPRRPFAEDTEFFNYEEDSDDDWEDEEQGESLDVSGDEEDKENATEEDDYEVDNEFFVPHGHLSDDEMDDEENAPLSPESLKQKLKLLKDEFELDIKSKTCKLKSRSIGCIWFNKRNENIDEAIYRYLQPFAMIVQDPVEIKDRFSIFGTNTDKKAQKVKVLAELPSEHVPYFFKIVQGNVNKKRTVIEEFLTLMANKGLSVDISKAGLLRYLKQIASYRRPNDAGASKTKCWCVNDEAIKKYNVSLDIVIESPNQKSTC